MGWNKTHSGRDWAPDDAMPDTFHRLHNGLHLKVWKEGAGNWHYSVKDIGGDPVCNPGTAWTKRKAQVAAFLAALDLAYPYLKVPLYGTPTT